MSETQKSETPAELLARSWFGFGVLAWLALLITWIGLSFSTPSPSPLYEQIRIGIVIGFGVLTLGGLWGIVRLFRISPENLVPFSERVAIFLQRGWLSIALLILLLEINFFIFMATPYIAPEILVPGKFLLVCWSILLAGLLLTINRAGISQWFEQTRGVWVSIGFSLTGMMVVAILLVSSNLLVEASGINALLRGFLDYRPLTFYDDGQPAPEPRDFWLEQAQTQIRWSPFTYWVVGEFQGQYINVSADGLRNTPQQNDNAEKTVFVFGGSTVWGEGARDAYTIPGHLTRLLDDGQVFNYGQTGYVSTQDLLWFQLQLINGNVPDVAVFYQGFNDVLASCDPVGLVARQSCESGLVGVTLQENFRIADSEAGRLLRNSRPVLQLPATTLNGYDLSGAAAIETTPQSVVDRWFANMEIIEILASAYDIETLFVWQPMLIQKSPLTHDEQAIVERTERERAGLFDLYTEVDAIVRNRCASACDNILLISDLFADDERTIFYDLVHITEVGNAVVAEAIAPRLQNILAD